MVTENLTDYEKEQLRLIEKWKQKKPGIIDSSVSYLSKPFVNKAESYFSENFFDKIFSGANFLGKILANKKSLLKFSKISSVSEMKDFSLNFCDIQATKFQKKALRIAIIEGGATGIAGLYGIAFDIPALIAIALQAIHNIGLCYGFECLDPGDKEFILGILASASANSANDKTSALAIMKSLEVSFAKKALKRVALQKTTARLAEEVSIIGIKNLIRLLSTNLSKRKFFQTLPIAGVLVGSTVNYNYIKEICEAAKRCFQERWLLEKEKIK